MRRIIGILILGSLIISVLTACGFNKNNLNGEIIMSSSNSGENDGISVYSPKKNKLSIILKGKFNDILDLNYNKNKMLCYKMDNEKTNKILIFEYDLVNKSIQSIERYDTKRVDERDIKYVPQNNKISYIYKNKLYILDMKSNREKVLLANIRSYSWDKNGEKIICGDWDDNIFEFNLKTEQKRKLFDGHDPMYSNNNKYISYISKNGILIINELDTQKEWKCDVDIFNGKYVFSPDDKYIAYGTQSTDLVHSPNFKIYALDFKNNSKTQLVKGHVGLPAFVWR